MFALDVLIQPLTVQNWSSPGAFLIVKNLERYFSDCVGMISTIPAERNMLIASFTAYWSAGFVFDDVSLHGVG